MNTTVVARKLNERRLRPNPVITTGEILSSIGSAGMQEAMERHWLVPDYDTGFMMVNMNAGKIAEVEEACKCPECKKPDCACESLGKDTLTPAVAREMPHSMRESWGGFGIGARQSSPAPAAPTAPPIMPRPAPASPTAAPAGAKAPQIGDDVLVAEQGKTFSGKVSTVGQDGRYRLSFGTDKPSMDREYGPNELRMVGQAAPNA
jgi:hypothetical protein